MMLVILVNIFSYTNKAKDQESMKKSFYEIVSTVSSICDSANAKTTKTITFPNIFNLIYYTEDMKYVSEEERNFGKYICIQFGEERICEEMKCDIEITTIAPGKSTLTLKDKILGQSPYVDIILTIEKTDCGVSILSPKEKSECMVEEEPEDCNGILSVVKTGNGICKIKLKMRAENCDGKIWEIKDSLNIKCGNIVNGNEYIFECPEFSIDSSSKITYTLFIDGERKDIRTIECGVVVSLCSPEEIVKKVDQNVMMKSMQELTKASRPYGNNRWAADYVKSELESYGLNVHFENFKSGLGRNIIGEIGTGDNIIIVTGGHIDSCKDCFDGDSTSRGAVDNTAGVVTIMETARIIASCKESLKSNKLRFVIFDGEEEGLFGSTAYVVAHRSENIERMLNFDCIGHKDSRGLFVARTASDLSDSADRACQSLNINCLKYGQIPCESDHCPFDYIGVDYMSVSCYLRQPSMSNIGEDLCGTCYHRSCENMSQISSEKLSEAGKFAAYVLADIYLK